MQKDNNGLKPLKFTPFSLTSISPRGWLKAQLDLQAESTGGKLDEFWPSIKNNRWIGGDEEDRDTYERVPYWLDGLIPLGYLTGNQEVRGKFEKYFEHILTLQQPDGWLGPDPENQGDFNIWAGILLTKALLQEYDVTHDARIINAAMRFYKYLDKHCESMRGWLLYRSYEALIPVSRLYEITGEKWLLDFGVKFKSLGFSWTSMFDDWPHREATHEKTKMTTHVVNNAMMIREAALLYRLTGQAGAKEKTDRFIRLLEKHHGMPTGVFTGDEHLGGTSPSRGTELCAVVEYMYSLEILSQIFGDPEYGDRLELITFNALPATFTPDMWAHQYDQQINQVECSIVKKPGWTNSPDANIYGLEPNFGCCTANFGQGWPKFASHLWMKSRDGGIAAIAYAPSSVKTEYNGKSAEIILDTDYPFKDNLKFTVNTEQDNCDLPIHLRIPAWAKKAKIVFADGSRVNPEPGTFHKLQRQWKNGESFTMILPMRAELINCMNNSVAVKRGPLAYALKMEEKWKRVYEDVLGHELPHGDWEVFPASPWNYALDIDRNDPDASLKFTEHPLNPPVFSPENAPVTCKVSARKIPEWKTVSGVAEDPPESPVNLPAASQETVTLIPYGCTNLRVTAFPTCN